METTYCSSCSSVRAATDGKGLVFNEGLRELVCFFEWFENKEKLGGTRHMLSKPDAAERSASAVAGCKVKVRQATFIFVK